MSYQLQITINLEKNTKLQNFVTKFDSPNELNVHDLKEVIKNTNNVFNFFNLKEENFYKGNKKLNELDLVKFDTSGLHYIVDVEKK